MNIFKSAESTGQKIEIFREIGKLQNIICDLLRRLGSNRKEMSINPMDGIIKDDQKFQNNYELMQAAIGMAQNMVFIKNTELEYVAVSDSFANLVGKPVKEIIGKTVRYF